MAQDAMASTPCLQSCARKRPSTGTGVSGKAWRQNGAAHSHPGSVGIAITDGKFRFTSPDGQSIEAELKAGQTICQDAVEHTTEVLGTSEAHVVIAELKGPKPQ